MERNLESTAESDDLVKPKDKANEPGFKDGGDQKSSGIGADIASDKGEKVRRSSNSRSNKAKRKVSFEAQKPEKGRSDTKKSSVAYQKDKKIKQGDKIESAETKVFDEGQYGQFVCTHCNRNVSKMIECELCECWACLQCQNVDEEVYNIFTYEAKFTGLHWFCNNCDMTIVETMSNMKNGAVPTASEGQTVIQQDAEHTPVQDFSAMERLAVRMEKKMNERMDHILNEAQSMLTRMMEVTEERMEKSYAEAVCAASAGDLGTNTTKQNSVPIRCSDSFNHQGQFEVFPTRESSASIRKERATPSCSVAEVVTLTVDELKDRDNRRNNIVVYNMQEPNETMRSKRQSKDNDQVKDMLCNGLCVDIQEGEIEQTTRLGIRGKGPDAKPRVLLVHFNDPSLRDEVIQACSKLRKTEKWRSVYIAPDLSKDQRQERWNLREELKRRKEEGEENLIIRNGKIIPVKPRPKSGNRGSTQSQEPCSTKQTIHAANQKESTDHLVSQGARRKGTPESAAVEKTHIGSAASTEHCIKKVDMESSEHHVFQEDDNSRSQNTDI